MILGYGLYRRLKSIHAFVAPAFTGAEYIIGLYRHLEFDQIKQSYNESDVVPDL